MLTFIQAKHRTMTTKLVVIVCAMFAFGYALVPLYRAICDITGINILARYKGTRA